MNSGCDVTRLINRSYFKYYNVLEWENMFSLGQNTMFQTKVVQNYIFYKKVNGRKALSPSLVEVWGTKDSPFLKYCTSVEK